MISHLLETSLYVSDLETSKEFYQRVFGLNMLLEDERMVALALPGSAVLLLFRRGGSKSPSPVAGGLFRRMTGVGRSMCAWRSRCRRWRIGSGI